MDSMIPDVEYIPEAKQPPLQLDVTDVNATLALTQQVRLMAVNEWTNGGTKLPDDPKNLITVLSHMDTAALTTRKLNIEEKHGDSSEALLEAFERLERLSGGKRGVNLDDLRDVTPESNLRLPAANLAPGEEKQGEQPLNVSDFLPESE